MKNFLLLLALFITHEAMAVCSSPISRTNFAPVTKLDSSKLNSDLNNVYTRLNELPGDCITDSTVTSSKILDGTIVNADISDVAAIARSKIGAVNIAKSSSSGSFTTSSGTYVDVTNLSISITTTGNPVELSLSSEGGGSCGVTISGILSTPVFSTIGFLKSGSVISELVQSANSTTSQTFTIGTPGGSYRYIDSPSSGTHTYKVQAKATGSSANLSVSNCILIAREL